MCKKGLILGLVSLGTSIDAATVLWDGGASDNKWTSGANWAGDIVPATSTPYDDVTFGTNSKNTVDVDTNVIVNTLRFVSGGTTAYTIGNSGTASTITIGNGFTGSPDGTNDIYNQSSAAQTINANIIQNGATGINAGNSGSLTINGSVNFNNAAGSRFLASSGGTLVLNGQITGNLGTAGSGTIAFNGGGTIEVRGASNNYTATTNIWGGTVRLFNANGFGSSTNSIIMGLSYDGGRLTAGLMLSSGINFTRNITLSSAHTNRVASYTHHLFTIGGDTADVSTYSGTITNSNSGQSNIAAALNVTAAAGGRVNIANIVRGSGVNTSYTVDDLNKIGAGTVAITGTLNNYQGYTNVNAGTLLVNGALLSVASGKGVDVKASATFGGTGVVNRSVTLANTATLAAGDPTVTNGLGLFTIGSGSGTALSVSATGGSIFDFQISTTSDINAGNRALNLNSDGSLNWASIVANAGGAYDESATLNNDSLLIQGDYLANTSGTTVVKLSAPVLGTFYAGSVWDLMDWTGSNSATSGSYSFQIDSALQSALTSQGLSLDTSRFWDTGLVGIAPEPGRGILLVLSVALLTIRRRRTMAV